MRVGIIFGKSMLLPKRNTYFEGFVENVFQPELVFMIGVSLPFNLSYL
jgi:hypothetical protein